MRVSKSKMFKTLVMGVAAATLAACGGGGGADSTVDGVSGNDAITLTVTADRTQLPLNLIGSATCASDGSLATTPYSYRGTSYMTTLYIQAKNQSGTALSGTGLFSFNVLSGFESGSLYYLDGNHETGSVTCTDSTGTSTTNATAGAYRYGTLDAASNGSTMHLLAGSTAGTIVVQYSVTDSTTSKLYTKSISITVGASTSDGLPSQVLVDSTTASYLYVQGVSGVSQATISVGLYDKAGQHVSDPRSGVNNLQVSIVSSSDSTAEDDARLLATNASGATMSGKTVYVATNNGVGQVTLLSGTTRGTITLEMIADHSDNNVSNGISDPVYNYYTFQVVKTVGGTPTITTTALADGTVGSYYRQLLEVSSGVPPYTWSLGNSSNPSTKLPDGLYLSTDGVIYGTPTAEVTNYQIPLTVTDDNGNTAEVTLTLTIAAQTPITFTTTSLSVCEGISYAATIDISGGTSPFTWTIPSAGGLSSIGCSIGSSTGILTCSAGTGTAGTYSGVVSVSDSSTPQLSASQTLTVTVSVCN